MGKALRRVESEPSELALTKIVTRLPLPPNEMNSQPCDPSGWLGIEFRVYRLATQHSAGVSFSAAGGGPPGGL